jgi:hypothetical protein
MYVTCGIAFYATGSLSEHKKFVQEEKPVAILGTGTVFHGCGSAVNRICAFYVHVTFV